jgi:branched-chain amino acid transport system permease protein
VYFMYVISRSSIGRAFDALRQDETVGATLGISIRKYHMIAFVLSGALAGFYGGMQSLYTYSIEPEMFGFAFLVAALTYIILGGRGTVTGPIIGAAIMSLLPELARPLADNRQFFQGVLMMVMVAFMPHGVFDGFVLYMRKRRAAAARSPIQGGRPCRRWYSVRFPNASAACWPCPTSTWRCRPRQDHRPDRAQRRRQDHGGEPDHRVYKLSRQHQARRHRPHRGTTRTKWRRRCLARTFQNIRLLPEATVLANVMIGMYRHVKASLFAQLFGLPSSRAKRRASATRAKLLERFGMTRYADYPAGCLAYGHQRRVEMMRALALKPAVLLLDEPVAGMNDVEAAKLGEIFRELATSGHGGAADRAQHALRDQPVRATSTCSTAALMIPGHAEKVVHDPAVVKAYLGARRCLNQGPARGLYSGNRGAARGVSLNVGQGEMVAIIGPNGAGKSTLLNCISGTVRHQRRIDPLEGRDITGEAAFKISRSGLLQVPEGRQILGELTCSRTCSWVTALHGSQAHARPAPHLHAVPDSGGAQPAAGRLAVGRPAADAGHRPCPDGRPACCCCSTSPAWACRRCSPSRCSMPCASSTAKG